MPQRPPSKPPERATLTGRVRRYGQVAGNVGGLAARAAGGRLLGLRADNAALAAQLRAALGGIKGPLMKVAQIAATVPDLLPPEFADELAKLQAHAPPMGWPFVKRRMAAELGPDWERRFQAFERDAAHAASLGQVHRATGHDGAALACKLQYPNMVSAVEADLQQLRVLIALYRRMDTALDPTAFADEIGARLREELDYDLEARHMALYATIFDGDPQIVIPATYRDLSTPRLLTMGWLSGRPLLEFRSHTLAERNRIAEAMFAAWWRPFNTYGAIHGDPHLGNYTVRPDFGINLLDFGCIRTFTPSFVQGVVGLYKALRDEDRDAQAEAYRIWGFDKITNPLIDALNIWARFIYGPLLDDRVRSIADGVKPSEYGRREAFEVHKRLRELGPVKPPREFVFMDRAAIGLGAVFLHLGAELNWSKLFTGTIEGFTPEALAARQRDAFDAAGVPLPV